MEEPGSQRQGIGQGDTMSDLRNIADKLAFAAYQAGEQGRSLVDCKEVAEWIAQIESQAAALERAQEWIEGDCTCPCCDGVQECVDGCTFAADCPSDAERMECARAVLFGEPSDKLIGWRP